MRVLALTNLYPNPYQPTRATFNRQQVAALARTHEVQVIAPIAWSDELTARRRGAPALPKGRRIEFDGLIVDHPRYYYPPKLGRRWYGHCYRLSVAKTFDRVVDEFHPDVVFAPWAYPDGWAAVRMAKRFKLPVIVKCHGSDVLSLKRHRARLNPTIETVRAADGVVAVSQHIAERLLEMGAQAERVRVVVDGVDRETFRPGSKDAARNRLGISVDKRLILFVGNLVPVKGVDVLLAACAELNKQNVTHHLIVIGDGPLLGQLGRQAVSLGIQSSVQFQGAVKHEQLPDWFRAADLFVLPSRSEGIPTVLLEASACHTPWVASHVGGIPEIADIGASRLVPPESVCDLVRAISELLVVSPPKPEKAPRSIEEAASELAAFLQAASSRCSALAKPVVTKC